RRAQAAGDLPLRALRDRHRHAGWRWTEAQVFEPDPRRRRRRGFSGHDRHYCPPVVALAGRGAVGVPAQAERVHRSFRLVAEVFLARAGPLREHAAEAQDVVRLGLPADHAGSMDEGLHRGGLQARGAAADPEGECDPRAAPGLKRAQGRMTGAAVAPFGAASDVLWNFTNSSAMAPMSEPQPMTTDTTCS